MKEQVEGMNFWSKCIKTHNSIKQKTGHPFLRIDFPFHIVISVEPTTRQAVVS